MKHSERDPAPPPLAALYDAVIAATARGDAREAHRAFLAAVGLRSRGDVAAVPAATPPLVLTARRYRGVRRIDWIALLAGARDIAKFEDLSRDAAARLAASLRARGLRVVIAGPYAKRFDIAVSLEDRGELFSVIASRDDSAREVAEAERDRGPGGARRAGLALGYPSCCVERFVAVERSELAIRDGVNEAAMRATAGLDGIGPWELNTLYDTSPVGFTPCSVDCPAALAFSRRILDALGAEDPAALVNVGTILRRPVLFFRFPVFWVLDGELVPGEPAVRYARAIAAEDDGGVERALRVWQEAELGAPLGAGDEVRLDAGGLEIRRAGAAIARWDVESPGVPLLLRFSD